MKNTNKILVGLLCLLGAALHAAQQEPVYVGKYSEDDYRVYPDNKNFKLFSSAEQAEIIRRLRAQLSDPDPVIRFQSGGSLLDLGDDAGIEYMVRFYHLPWSPKISGGPESQLSAERSLESAAYAGTAPILPYLMDDVYHGSPQSRVIADGMDVVSMPSIQEQSIEMALKSIIKSSAYPAAVRNWATQTEKTFYRYAPVEQRLQALAQLKAWWEHNKDAVLAKDYAKATWLPTTAGQAPPALSAPAKNPVPVSLTTPSPAPSESSPALKWLLLAAATLAALGLGWRFLRRK